MIKSLSSFRAHAAIFVASLALDQITKWWARVRFSLPGGEPDYGNSIAVLGDWLHLRLVYNHGAAFGLKPHAILPFLHPMSFYVIFAVAAIILLTIYYRRLGPSEPSARLGIVLILSGAVGNNLIDRLAMHKVTDFLDAGIPGFYPRWPVFNVADSAVCIGLALLIIPPLLTRRPSEAAIEEAASEAEAEAETPDLTELTDRGGAAETPESPHMNAPDAR